MNRIILSVFLLAVASGCANLPDSIKGPFAASGRTATDVTHDDQPEVSPYPKQSPFGN